jgi:hypothetical protein
MRDAPFCSATVELPLLTLSGNLERSHLALDPGADPPLGYAQIVKRLEIQPEFGAGSEAASQTQGGISRNPALAAYDFIQPSRSSLIVSPGCGGSVMPFQLAIIDYLHMSCVPILPEESG